MKIDGVSAVALILIASFGVDRIVTGLLFLLSWFSKAWNGFLPDPTTLEDRGERVMAEKKQKLVYFIFAGVLGGLVLAFLGEIRIFRAMGFEKTNYILDSIMTGLILMAGSDRVAEILKLTGAPGAERPKSPPIEVTGRLILEGEAPRKVRGEQDSLLPA